MLAFLELAVWRRLLEHRAKALLRGVAPGAAATLVLRIDVLQTIDVGAMPVPARPVRGSTRRCSAISQGPTGVRGRPFRYSSVRSGATCFTPCCFLSDSAAPGGTSTVMAFDIHHRSTIRPSTDERKPSSSVRPLIRLSRILVT